MNLRPLRGWLVRLFSVFHRKQREQEFAEELASHLAFHTEFRIILDSMEPQNVQIAPEIIQAITREAAARGLSVDEYLRQALGVMNGTPAPDSQTLARPFYETATVEEWVREFTKWAESHGPNTPGLTREDVSRERMYED